MVRSSTKSGQQVAQARGDDPSALDGGRWVSCVRRPELTSRVKICVASSPPGPGTTSENVSLRPAASLSNQISLEKNIVNPRSKVGTGTTEAVG